MTPPRAAAELVDPEAPDEGRGEILSVHFGPSANCSSIGSFVDFLFVSSIVGGAAIAMLAATLDARVEAAESGDADEEE